VAAPKVPKAAPPPPPAPAPSGHLSLFGGPDAEDGHFTPAERQALIRKYNPGAAKPAAKPGARPAATKSLAKEKTKKTPAAGVKVQTGAKDHTKKLTKHGLKPVVLATKESPDKPTPQVPMASKMDYAQGTKRKGVEAPRAKPASLRKKVAPVEPANKRVRRVSAKDV
jgi:hypothetical protein